MRQLCENGVIIVLTDCKVHIVAGYHVDIQSAQLLDVLPFALILVPNLFVAETVPQLEQLDYILGSLFKHDESIDIPGVKPYTILSVQNEFSEKFENNENDLVVGMKSIQSSFNYW